MQSICRVKLGGFTRWKYMYIWDIISKRVYSFKQHRVPRENDRAWKYKTGFKNI